MESNLAPEFVDYFNVDPNRPKVGRGQYVDLHHCANCPLRAYGCLFGQYAARNIKLGHTKLFADMCAYRNGFHIVYGE